MEKCPLGDTIPRVRYAWLHRLFIWMVDNPYKLVLVKTGPPGTPPQMIPAATK